MKEMINIALPKGRLGDKVYDMFEAAGYPCPSIKEDSRRLIFESEEAGVRYFWVKPSDVAIYVERGAADIGVAGRDILLEYEPDIYDWSSDVCSSDLSGSIEIAPILGLSDVIVDIVETGTTLRENDLEIIDTIVGISARLIANKAAFKFRNRRIEKICGDLRKITGGEITK